MRTRPRASPPSPRRRALACALALALLPACRKDEPARTRARPDPRPPAPPAAKRPPPPPSRPDTPEDHRLVSGTISVHPLLADKVVPGGSAHVRLMDLTYRRPIMFKRIDLVPSFPFTYEFRSTEFVGSGGAARLAQNHFYVEVFYAPPGQELYEDRGSQFGGEGWGLIGKPYPVHVGDVVNVTIAALWSPELYSGILTHPEGSLIEGWVFPLESLAGAITPQNRLTIVVVKKPVEPGVQDRPPVVLATKIYEDVDPRRPLAFHMTEEDVLVKPVDARWQGYFFACLETMTPDRTTTGVLLGRRASPGTVISVFTWALRIALQEHVPLADPKANPCRKDFRINPGRFVSAQPTYE